MSTEIFKLCAAAVAVCAVTLVLRRIFPEYAAVASAVGAAAIFLFAVSGFSEIIEFAGRFEKMIRLPQSSEVIIKACTVMLTCEITADICERADEAVLAKALTAAGKLEIAVIGLPLFSELIETAVSLCA